MLPRGQGQSPDRSDKCTPKIDRHVIKRFTQDKMIWNAAAQPSIFPRLFYSIGGKRTGFRLTLQNIFMFLFLRNGVREVLPISSE